MKKIILGIGAAIAALAHTIGTHLVNKLYEAVMYRYRVKNTNPFASIEDIASNRYGGFIIDGQRAITKKMAFEGIYLQGPTGCGKSSTNLITSILHMNDSSMCIHDSAGELYEQTAGYLASRGFKTYVINFSNIRRSHFYNPLSFVESTTDVQKMCALLVRSVLGDKSSEPFWNIQATSTLATIVEMTLKFPPEYRNFANVQHLLKNFGIPKKLDLLFATHADPKLFADYLSLKAMDPKVLSSVTATALAALNMWNADDVCQITSSSSFDFSELRTSKCAIYLQGSTGDSKYFSPLRCIFFEQLLAEIMKSAPLESHNDIFVCLDETATLADLPTLPVAMCNVRKFRCGILTTWQTYESAVQAHGASNAEVIRSNSKTHLYFSGQNLKTCQFLEQLIDKVRVADSKGRVSSRPAMTAAQIRTMKKEEALVVCGNHKPMKVTLVPYYLQNAFNRYSKIKPPVVENTSFNPIPLVHIL